ncbi:MAG: amidohydrolase [Bacteroidetes bacterium]|nr:amidohydrolase [Bacteroidota bacterium]
MSAFSYAGLRQMADGLTETIVKHRRHLHRFPELSFGEVKTAAYIAEVLGRLGIPYQTSIAGHGVVAYIRGEAGKGRCIALRADMDALPIEEKNATPYASVHKGVMHACGHDAHMAMLLGAADLLSSHRSAFSGTVKLIFQPAEEQLPGGAKAMIEAGVLHNPEVEAIVALHVSPEMPVGTLGFCPGPFMASGDEINIRILGKGGHAAMPDKAGDVVLAAAQVLLSLQQLISRNTPPLLPAVLSFGRLIAQGAHNILPDEALLQGTFRTFDEAYRAKAKQRIAEIARHTAQAAGTSAEVDIVHGYPVLINQPGLTGKLKTLAATLFGESMVATLPQRMTTEDFAYYSQLVPACFIRLGTGNDALQARLHTPDFDIDESALPKGAAMLAAAALSLLSETDQF